MRYSPSSIEVKWQKRWLKDRIYEPDFKRATRPFYNLMMFPYPSAEGLHVGNMYAFIGADIFGRFQRMQGYDVFEPIGLDGFGIHSENYALKINKHPADQAKISEKNFYRQLETLGNGFAWRERLETYDPSYYCWTQWIFVQMFKRGLAYRKKQAVNWCSSCKTVLADEQVISGECERCGTVVVKRELEQWFFRITKYAGRLLKNLNTIDWSERIKIAQRNWIGKSEGLLFRAPVKDTGIEIETFSAHFEAFRADTFVVIAPDHPLLDELLVGISNRREILYFAGKLIVERKKEVRGNLKPRGIFTGRYVIDPVGNGELPIWIANYAVKEYGTGIVKCSAHDVRDFAFAKKYKLRLKPVLFPKDPVHRKRIIGLQECYTDMSNGYLSEPKEFAGKRAGDVRKEIVKYVIRKGLAKSVVQYRLRDWLISRQRYWGPPIPMIHCAACAAAGRGDRKDMPGWYAVPEKDLPVKLPYIKNFRPTGTDKSPLATVEKFWKVRCPKCKSWARRETDVSDTFFDSAWYYLRYPSTRSARSGQVPWDPAITKKWFPVDMYIGGAEHAVLHLLYVRFLAMAFYDWGLTYFEEPFKKFRAHGLLIKSGAKMSKSRGNVVNPDEYIKAYGADALRMYLMFLGPFEQGGDFSDTGIRGITRFLERVWRFVQNSPPEAEKFSADLPAEASAQAGGGSLPDWQAGASGGKTQNAELEPVVHRTIKKVTADMEGLQYNTAISSLMVLLNAFEDKFEVVAREHVSIFLRLLAPFAPHIAEELWHVVLGEKTSVHKSRWPEVDRRHLVENRVTVAVQVNGRMRDRVEVAYDIKESEIKSIVLSRPKVLEFIGRQAIRKFIYVPGRIVSIVI